MNELAVWEQNGVAVPQSTKDLIRACESANTLRAYRRVLLELNK